MEPEDLKQSNQIAIKQPSCEFYVQRKSRYCKFAAAKNSKFCAAHCSDLKEKVQCPYQKGMYIDAAKFQKHLEICPMIKNRKRQENNQWFSKGVNLVEQAEKVHKPDHLSSTSSKHITAVIHKTIKMFVDCFQEQAKAYLVSTEEEKIGETNDHSQAKLLADETHRCGLIGEKFIYLEFGAGKGILSYAIANKVKEVCKAKSKHVLLERESRRNKFDRFMKDNAFFQRYRGDVSDFDMQKLPEIIAQTALLKSPTLDYKKEEAHLRECQLVGVCKHMCGGALDISLRGLLRFKINGCILASCCHHLCSYDTYLNNKFFHDKGLTKEDIQVLFKLSSWGTKKTTIHQENIVFEELLSKQYEDLEGIQKTIIGRMCKRMIDIGRANYIQANLVRYCSDQLTPENYAITASFH